MVSRLMGFVGRRDRSEYGCDLLCVGLTGGKALDLFKRFHQLGAVHIQLDARDLFGIEVLRIYQSLLLDEMVMEIDLSTAFRGSGLLSFILKKEYFIILNVN